MKSILRSVGTVAAIVTVVGLSACANAAPPENSALPYAGAPCAEGYGTGMGMGHGRGSGMFGRFADPQQVDGIKSQIGIRSDQEAVWNAYVKAIQDAMAARLTDRQAMGPQAMQAMSPDDRRAFMLSKQESRQQSFRTVSDAANVLLASLDDGQKYRAQGLLAGLAGPGRMGHGMMGGGMMGGGRGW